MTNSSFTAAYLSFAAILILGCSDSRHPIAPPPPSPPAAPPTPTGQINLTVSSIGVDIDYNGYQPWIDDRASATIPANGSVTIAGLTIGTHIVRLEGLELNCVLVGPKERTVDVTSAGTASVAFTVSCARNGELAFVEGILTNIYVINSDGTGTSQLTNNQWNSEPAWSPDGSRIAFVRYRDQQGYGIFLMNANGTGVVSLTTGRGDDMSPTWSPDGARIAFSRREFGKDGIYVMNADGTNRLRITIDPARDADPAWSPDGNRIAFTRDNRIYLMNPDGSALTKLSPDDARDSEPAWSSDGRKIAFSREAATGNSAIFTMEADGSNPTRLTQDLMHAGNPAWSKDGRIALETIAECHTVPWWFDECTGEILVVRPDKTTYYLTSIGLAVHPTWRP